MYRTSRPSRADFGRTDTCRLVSFTPLDLLQEFGTQSLMDGWMDGWMYGWMDDTNDSVSHIGECFSHRRRRWGGGLQPLTP